MPARPDRSFARSRLQSDDASNTSSFVTTIMNVRRTKPSPQYAGLSRFDGGKPGKLAYHIGRLPQFARKIRRASAQRCTSEGPS